MGIIDQVYLQSTPDEAPSPSRATLSTPRRYVFEKRDSLDDMLGFAPPSICDALSEQFRAPTPSVQPPEIDSSTQRKSVHEMVEDMRSAAIHSARTAQEHASRRVQRLDPASYLHERVYGVSDVASRVCSAHDLTPSALPGQHNNDHGYGTADLLRTKASALGTLARRRRESSEGSLLAAAAAAERLAATEAQKDLMLHAECEAAMRACKKPAGN